MTITSIKNLYDSEISKKEDVNIDKIIKEGTAYFWTLGFSFAFPIFDDATRIVFIIEGTKSEASIIKKIEL